MSRLFEGRDWEIVDSMIAPVIEFDMYGQRCPDCGTIFPVAYGSFKWKYCPECGKNRETIKRDPTCEFCAHWDKENANERLNMSRCYLNQMNTCGNFYCTFFDERRTDATLY